MKSTSAQKDIEKSLTDKEQEVKDNLKLVHKLGA